MLPRRVSSEAVMSTTIGWTSCEPPAGGCRLAGSPAGVLTKTPSTPRVFPEQARLPGARQAQIAGSPRPTRRAGRLLGVHAMLDTLSVAQELTAGGIDRD